MARVVLIVDDSATVRLLLRRVLSAAGHEVAEAADGEIAWDRLHAEPRPDAMISDVNMPRMSGLELLRRMAEDGAPRVPTLMLTTEGQVEWVREARSLGAVGWMIKPPDPALLLSAVDAMFRGRE